MSKDEEKRSEAFRLLRSEGRKAGEIAQQLDIPPTMLAQWFSEETLLRLGFSPRLAAVRARSAIDTIPHLIAIAEGDDPRLGMIARRTLPETVAALRRLDAQSRRIEQSDSMRDSAESRTPMGDAARTGRV